MNELTILSPFGPNTTRKLSKKTHKKFKKLDKMLRRLGPKDFQEILRSRYDWINQKKINGGKTSIASLQTITVHQAIRRESLDLEEFGKRSVFPEYLGEFLKDWKVEIVKQVESITLIVGEEGEKGIKNS